MVSSITEIANLALLMLGESAILDIDDVRVKTARVMKTFYPSDRDAVLRSHRWNFAKARIQIAADTVAPQFQWTFAHTLPADYIRILGLDSSRISYVVEDGKLLANETPVRVHYVKRVTDITKFDSLFVAVLAARLAADTCIPIKGSDEMFKTFWQAYMGKLVEARGVNAQELGSNQTIEAETWLDSRFGAASITYNDWDPNI